MRLTELTVGLDWIKMDIGRDVDIAGLTSDSRRVAPGFLFAALPGTAEDGRAFIGDALDRGAAAVVAPEGDIDVPGVPVLYHANPRRAYARMAGRFFQPQPETVVAVTGTNGKTSVAEFARQIWRRLGHRSASLGTLGIISDDGRRDGGLTTPDASDLHAALRDLAKTGTGHVALEASSHGLDQHRLDGVVVAAAGFTNLSRDHLDYHGDMDRYLAAKSRLFTEVMAPGGTAVLNADDSAFDALTAAARDHGHRVWSYGRDGAEFRLDDFQPSPDGQLVTAYLRGSRRQFRLPLIGSFQVYNALCALGLVAAAGAELSAAADALEFLEDAPGRLQLAATHVSGAPVYVDYAHTPDALERVLAAARQAAAGRVCVVFGCGGDRDRGKRPEMGAVAARLADVVIVTDDNPRTEDAAAIRAEILAAVPGASEIGDRMAAIETAVAGLRSGDVLVIAGKGHEQGQIIGSGILPFDDVSAARTAVRKGAA